MSSFSILISPHVNKCIWSNTRVNRGDRVIMYSREVYNAYQIFLHTHLNNISKTSNIYFPKYLTNMIANYCLPNIQQIVDFKTKRAFQPNTKNMYMVIRASSLVGSMFKKYKQHNKKKTIMDMVRDEVDKLNMTTKSGRIVKSPERFQDISYIKGNNDQYDRGFANNECGSWGSETIRDNSIGINTSSYNTNDEFVVSDESRVEYFSDTIQSEDEIDFDSDASETDIESDFEMEDLTDTED